MCVGFVTYVTLILRISYYLCHKKRLWNNYITHEVLHMMEGNSYTELSLRKPLSKNSASSSVFFTYSANNMDVDT